MARTPPADKKKKKPTKKQLAALAAGRRSRKGIPNKVTTEGRLAAAQMVDDLTYRQNLFQAMRDRTVPPMIEAMIWYYAKGKPKDVQIVDGNMTICWLDREPKAEPEPEDGQS